MRPDESARVVKVSAEFRNDLMAVHQTLLSYAETLCDNLPQHISVIKNNIQLVRDGNQEVIGSDKVYLQHFNDTITLTDQIARVLGTLSDHAASDKDYIRQAILTELLDIVNAARAPVFRVAGASDTTPSMTLGRFMDDHKDELQEIMLNCAKLDWVERDKWLSEINGAFDRLPARGRQ